MFEYHFSIKKISIEQYLVRHDLEAINLLTPFESCCSWQAKLVFNNHETTVVIQLRNIRTLLETSLIHFFMLDDIHVSNFEINK